MTVQLWAEIASIAVGFGAVVAAVVGIVQLYLQVRPAKGACLSYRTYSDTQLVEPARARPADWKLSYRDRFSGKYEEALNLSTAVIGVRNSGSVTVTKEDFAHPITITFENRKVLNAEIVESGHVLMNASILYKQESDHFGESDVIVDESGNRRSESPDALKVKDGSVTLPQILINPKNEFKLFFWLSGAVDKIDFDANIKHGVMKEDTGYVKGPGRLLRWPWIVVIVAIFIASVGGFVVSRTILASNPIPKICVPGHVSVEGSSAFRPATLAIAIKYMSICPSSRIDVTATDSGQAIHDLEQGAISMAMTDGPFPKVPGSLFYHKEAVVIFSVIVNNSTGIHSLSVTQIQSIYSGQYKNWRSVGGSGERIVVVDREALSGTRAAFERTVLRAGPKRRIRAELRTSTTEMLRAVNGQPGAIGYAETTAASNNREYPHLSQVELTSPSGRNIVPSIQTVKNGLYPFWAIEYFYTNGAPPRDGLLAAFIRYLMWDKATGIMLDFGHIPCHDEVGGTRVLCS